MKLTEAQRANLLRFYSAERIEQLRTQATKLDAIEREEWGEPDDDDDDDD